MLPRFEDLNPEISALIESLLPASVLEISRLVGLQAALLIVDNFGGMDIDFASDAKRNRRKDFFLLCDVIGEEKARTLALHYPVMQKMYVPKCLKAMNALRDLEIVDLFDKMTRRISVQKACNDIARRFRLSARSVHAIVSRAKIES